ncbi:MAG: hypothetical protein ACT4OM_01520 [Actinomycetota bacterium]
MEPTKQDAEAMLKEAEGIELAVRTRTPEEHVPFFAWGLMIALHGPLRDLGDSVAGGILLWVGFAVPAAVLVPYMLRSRQVRMRAKSPTWLAIALGAWAIAAGLFLPRLLDGTIGFAYTLGGILAAVPLLLWAERLRRNA